MNKIRLFVIPHAGGHKYNYNLFKPYLEDNFAFTPIEYPGRGEQIDLPLVDDSTMLVDYLYEQLAPYLTSPYAIWGHSMGATLGYLVTRLIEKRGHSLPLNLFLSGRRAPSLEPEEILHHLPSKEFWEKLELMGGLSPDFMESKELRQYFEPILRADCKISEIYHYQPEEPLTVPVTVLLGRKDTNVDFSKVSAWQMETRHSMKVHEFDGDHFFIFQHPLEVTELITQALLQ